MSSNKSRFRGNGLLGHGQTNYADPSMSEHTPRFFPAPADFRAWLEEHHAATDHLWVGYYKKATNKPSVTWEDTVDEALCYGWIDGIRKSRDDESYMIRFTPRKPRSVWSQRNIDLVERLSVDGPDGNAIQADSGRMGILPRTTARLPQANRELGDQRKA